MQANIKFRKFFKILAELRTYGFFDGTLSSYFVLISPTLYLLPFQRSVYMPVRGVNVEQLFQSVYCNEIHSDTNFHYDTNFRLVQLS